MKERVHYLSFASVIATISVVLIHVNSMFFWYFDSKENWIYANLIEYLMKFAVPVFFMISGANLIDYNERYSTKIFIKKRVNKTIVPFISWCILGFIYKIVVGANEFDFTIKSFKKAFLEYLNSDILFIYWFFIVLFGIYLFIPIISAIRKDKREKIVIYIMLYLFVVKYAIPFICKIYTGDFVGSNLMSDAIESYLIYVLIGYIICKRNISWGWRVISYLLSAMALVGQVYATYCLSVKAGVVVTIYDGYNNILCLVYSVGVFIFLKQIGQKITNDIAIKAIETLSKYTFAVYLMHYLFVDLFKPAILGFFSVLNRIIFSIAIFMISVVITWFMRKIPIVRRILP